MTPSASRTDHELLDRIRDAILGRQRFLITSHVKPDGDSIGSQVALACALRVLGKQVRVVNKDAAAPSLLAFPGVAEIEIADRAEGEFDAVIVLECGDLARTGVAGLERHFIINIDHHPGNALFGAINWFDGGAAACGEMVFDLVARLGVTLSRDIALPIYIAILTDTGSFHHSSISPRTFDICRQALEAGVDPVAVARGVYDSNSVGRIRLFGAVLGAMQVDASGRVATLYLDHDIAAETGGAFDDTEGLINTPLTVKEIQAVVFFKQWETARYRVSLRSKAAIDVCGVARQFGGGGHKNASGFSFDGVLADLRARVLPLVDAAVDGGTAAARPAAGPDEPTRG
jgi:bifunctional oligoribonuclease and PAP phosphatase NrnA